MQFSQEYFAMMYYSFILLVALDKAMSHVNKESKYKKKYYAKYEHEADDHV